ncbi:lasso peptide biosynthesis B2 protein [Streptomyces sp. NBC_01317]|uniref:lasso peptide biosynthesis B2 protein n=1 Tax=Streptomyces sp. NBC_01317 TaxID=2903822 RepID=UPI002E108469|nr:lasso peptide biosynthesis B2 protein [Streptomyces sp. NBC_01317]
MPDGVHRRSIGHDTTAVLVEATGCWAWLDRDTRNIWEAALNGRLPQLVDELCRLGYQREQVQAAVSQTVNRLTSEGMLATHHRAVKTAVRPGGASPRPGAGWTDPITPGNSQLPLRIRAVALVGLAASLAALRLPLRRLLRALVPLRRLPAARGDHAEILYRAVVEVRPAWWPGRIACMEMSLATVLAAALCGRRVHWVLGARPLPNEAHAWVVVEGGGALGLDGPDQNNPVRPWVPVITTPPPARVNR